MSNKPQTGCKQQAARSRTGFVIRYTSCPIIWNSKLQTEVALSTPESENIALSSATREILPLIELIQELDERGCGLSSYPSNVVCRVFEDDSGAVELVTSTKPPKIRPRTKHINTKYHHFRVKVLDGTLQIQPILTTEMLADILTKITLTSLELSSLKDNT